MRKLVISDNLKYSNIQLTYFWRSPYILRQMTEIKSEGVKFKLDFN